MFSNKPFRSATEYAFLSNYDRYELLISGYNKQIESLTKLTIPPEIWNLIHKYYIFKLIKLILHDNIDESKYISRGILQDITLKQLFSTIQVESFNKKTNKLPSIHSWMKFNQIKQMFPIDKPKALVTENDLSTINPQKWMEIPDDYAVRPLLSAFNDLCFMIELKASDNTCWPRFKFEDKIEWDQIETGDIIDCKDNQNKWYESWVRFKYPKGHKYENQIVIHFIGYNLKFDERFSISDCWDRIAIRNRHTKAPHRAKKYHRSFNVNIILNQNEQRKILIEPKYNAKFKKRHSWLSFQECLRNGLNIQKNEKDIKLKCYSGFIPTTMEHIRYILPFYLGNMELLHPTQYIHDNE